MKLLCAHILFLCNTFLKGRGRESERERGDITRSFLKLITKYYVCNIM